MGLVYEGRVLERLESEVLAPARSVTLEDLSEAASLIGATTVTCAGMAVAATALSGWRRAGIPLALALVWALLAHGAARAWHGAWLELAALGSELESARETHGREALLVVIDPYPSATAAMVA